MGFYLTSRKLGIEQLFNQLLRPKLRNFVLDIHRDISYILDEDGYTTADYQDLVRKRFVKTWESLIDGYKVVKMATGLTYSDMPLGCII